MLRLDIEHFGVHFNAWEISRQMRRPRPVRGCPLVAQQARMGKHERPQAQADHQRAPFMGCLKRFEECARRPFGDVPPAGNDDDVSSCNLVQTMVTVDRETGVGNQRPIFTRTHHQFEPGRIPHSAIFTKYEARHRKVKGADAVKGDDCNFHTFFHRAGLIEIGPILMKNGHWANGVSSRMRSL